MGRNPTVLDEMDSSLRPQLAKTKISTDPITITTLLEVWWKLAV